jgi:hypothetical protein
MTPSIRIAMEDVAMSNVAVLYPGTKRYPIAERVEAVPVQALEKGTSIFEKVKS